MLVDGEQQALDGDEGDRGMAMKVGGGRAGSRMSRGQWMNERVSPTQVETGDSTWREPLEA